MAKTFRAAIGAMLAGAIALTLAGCDLDVSNPEVIDAGSFDPTSDAATLSLSAQTNFFDAFGDVVVYSAYYSDEAWVGAARQETNDFARRIITFSNLDLNPNIWAPLSLAIASNEKALQVLEAAPDASSNVDLARAAMSSAFSLELMGEYFCQGVILVGPPLSAGQILDSAIVRFQRAIDVGAAAGGDEGDRIVFASMVGLARARLQKGDNENAVVAAADVPDSFVFNAAYVDDPASRGRVGNDVFDRTASGTFVAPESYRALNDPRVQYADQGSVAQDGQLELVIPTKYTSYGDDIRIASGLEARYIEAEAELKLGDPSAALDLVGARRAANGQSAFTGNEPDAILAELMDQRARDFWLEAKHLGDALRNPAATPYVAVTGSPYYKASQGNFGDLACLPIPKEEQTSNPNFLIQ